MRQNINNLIDRITQECKLNEEYLNEGNSVKANIASKKLLKIRNDLLEDRELSEKIINELIYHQNPTVKSYIASIMDILNSSIASAAPSKVSPYSLNAFSKTCFGI